LALASRHPQRSTRHRGGLKDASPSNDLRKRFHNNPNQWNKFCRLYFAEREEAPAAWEPLLEAVSEGKVTLVYAARDPIHNNAIALKEFLESRRR
jgi:uncharacterized protein YeaO (DUF488 family)